MSIFIDKSFLSMLTFIHDLPYLPYLPYPIIRTFFFGAFLLARLTKKKVLLCKKKVDTHGIIRYKELVFDRDIRDKLFETLKKKVFRVKKKVDMEKRKSYKELVFDRDSKGTLTSE